MNISFCIITLNEEQNLARCLQSCRGLADEIVVVDSGSTDGTESVARRYGTRWVAQPWLGFVGQKNHALGLARNEWVFSIDADEALSPGLREEIELLRSIEPADDRSGFSMPRCVLYEGRWIRHGDWYPDRLVRLFRRSRGHFAGGRVHERLELEGRVVPLRGDLQHHSFRDAADHRARCEKYAGLWAESAHESGRRAGFLEPAAHAAFRWVRGYLLRRGFLDGSQGFRIAAYSARETYWKYKLLRRLNRTQELGRRAEPR
jgi:glycosyltransferase involved in cell wall biosynthesis